MTDPTPIPAAAVTRHALADVINRARYRSPEGGLPERGVDEESSDGRRYAYQIADAVMFALPHLASPAGDVADLKAVLEAVQGENTQLRGLLDNAEAERDEARRDREQHVGFQEDRAINAERERDALAERLRGASIALRAIADGCSATSDPLLQTIWGRATTAAATLTSQASAEPETGDRAKP